MQASHDIPSADGRVLRVLNLESAEWIAQLLRSSMCEGLLDFGGGRSALSARELLYMARSKAHFLRTVHEQATDRLEGVVGVMGVDNPHGVATIWGARPILMPPAGYSVVNLTRAICRWIFENTAVRSIQTWVLEVNKFSVTTTISAGFTPTGRMRSAHVYRGRRFDRLLFDLTAEEFFEQEARWSAKASAIREQART